MWLSDTSIKQPVLVTMLMVLAVVLGFLAFQALPVDLLPDISFPAVNVSVVLPGAGPQEMAEQVAKPVEDGMGTLQGVRQITSRSSEGITNITIQFTQDRKVDQAAQDVRDKMNQIRPALPIDIREPIIQKFDLSSAPVMSIAVAGKSKDTTVEQLTQQIEDVIIPQLQRVDGVAAADLSGGRERQINVNLNLQSLIARGLSPQQVSQAIQAENVSVPIGKITQGGADVALRAPGEFKTVEAINDVNIGTRSGPVHLHDIATIDNGIADVTTFSRLNGQDTVRIDIRKQSGTNTVRVADGVKAELTRIFGPNQPLTYSVVRDDSIQVRNTVNDALLELVLGVISAIIVVFIFFRDARNTIVAVVGLPVILIATFAAMRMFGLTINLMTLLALTLCVGLVIDDAIVVRENVFRWMERGYDPKVAASKATAQVALSVLAMSLTIVAVFLPVALVSGIVSGFFRPFGLTVASAMVISLVEAFTLAPMLSAYFFKKREDVEPPAEEGEVAEEAAVHFGRLDLFYQRILGWTLRHRWLTIGIGVLVIAVTLFAARGLKVAFAPSIDSGQFYVGYRMPPGTALSETDKVARSIETLLQNDAAVETVLTTVGVSGQAEQGQVFIQLKHGEKTPSTQERIRPALANVPNVSFSVPGFGGAGTDVSGRPVQIQLQSITGNLNDLLKAADQVKAAIKDIPGLTDVDTDYQPGRPELQIVVDRLKASDQGVSTAVVGSTLRTMVNGSKASTYREGGNEYDIVVRLRPEDRNQINDILNVSVPSSRGGLVPLNMVASAQMGSSPTRITRQDRLLQVAIGGNNFERNLNDIVQEVRTRTRDLQLPSGVSIVFGGQQQQQTEGFQTLFQAMFLSVLFIYMVLASQFGSFLQPLVIMLAIPLSFIGAFLGLRLTNLPLDILGLVGMILLIGLATKNSILLVDFTNRLRKVGLRRDDALLTAAPARLRPILMTTLAIMIGSLPVAIGIGEGSEFRRPLAIVTIFGLLTSMLLTLFIVPTAYSLLDSGISGGKRVLAWRPGRRRRAPAPRPTVPQPSPSTQGGSD